MKYLMNELYSENSQYIEDCKLIMLKKFDSLYLTAVFFFKFCEIKERPLISYTLAAFER